MFYLKNHLQNPPCCGCVVWRPWFNARMAAEQEEPSPERVWAFWRGN